MTNKYISLKSILFDISQLVDERYWDEVKVTEWAAKGFRSLNITSKYKDHLCEVIVENHKASLPKDFARQVILFDQETKQPYSLASSPVVMASCLTLNPLNTKCAFQYIIDQNLILTTNVKDANLVLHYLAYPTDENGLYLIPDEEVVKEAITAYVLWKMWTAKWLMKEEGAESRMEHFRQQWSTYSKKALSLNAPDIPEMENIMNRWNHIVPRENMYLNLFSNLNQKENVHF